MLVPMIESISHHLRWSRYHELNQMVENKMILMLPPIHNDDKYLDTIKKEKILNSFLTKTSLDDAIEIRRTSIFLDNDIDDDDDNDDIDSRLREEPPK
jgi:hypothetical protein